MSRPSCPECRALGKTGKLGAVFGNNPAGRCDEHYEARIIAAAEKISARERAKAAAKAEREMLATKCVDCRREGLPLNRPATEPGPRCATHWRVAKKARRKTAHETRMAKNFELEPGDYDRLYEAQGGRCYGCQTATGKRKRLAVDHDHQCQAGHDPKKGCYLCIRALLCGQCNQILGRYGVEKLRRLIEVIENPPARKVLLDS